MNGSLKIVLFLLTNALQSIYWGYLNSKQIINQLSVLRPIVLQFNLVWIQCPNYQLISRLYYDAIFLNHNNSNQQLTSKSDPFYLFPAVLLQLEGNYSEFNLWNMHAKECAWPMDYSFQKTRKKTLNKYRFSRRFSICYAVCLKGEASWEDRMIPFLLILLEDDAQKTNK